MLGERRAVLRALAFALGSVLVAMLLAGCSSTDEAGPTGSAEPSNGAVDAGADAPLFASDDEALAAASEVYLALLAVESEVGAAGGHGYERMYEYVTAEMEGYVEAAGPRFIAKERWTEGIVTADTFSLQRWSQSDEVTTVHFYACLDMTDLALFEGADTVLKERGVVNRQPLEITVNNSEGKFKVGSSKPWSGNSFCLR